MKRTENIKYYKTGKGRTAKTVEIFQNDIKIVEAVLGEVQGNEISRKEYDAINVEYRKSKEEEAKLKHLKANPVVRRYHK